MALVSSTKLASVEQITALTTLMKALHEPQKASAAKRKIGKLPKRVCRPAWNLIGKELSALQPRKRPATRDNEFDVRYLDSVIDAMQSIVGFTQARVPKKVGKAAWKVLRAQMCTARDSSDLGYLETLLVVAEFLEDIVAERPVKTQIVKAGVSKSTARLANAAVADYAASLLWRNEPAALPPDQFVDLAKLDRVLNIAQLLVDVSYRKPPRKVADKAWVLILWQLQSIASLR